MFGEWWGALWQNSPTAIFIAMGLFVTLVLVQPAWPTRNKGNAWLVLWLWCLPLVYIIAPSNLPSTDSCIQGETFSNFVGLSAFSLWIAVPAGATVWMFRNFTTRIGVLGGLLAVSLSVGFFQLGTHSLLHHQCSFGEVGNLTTGILLGWFLGGIIAALSWLFRWILLSIGGLSGRTMAIVSGVLIAALVVGTGVPFYFYQRGVARNSRVSAIVEKVSINAGAYRTNIGSSVSASELKSYLEPDMKDFSNFELTIYANCKIANGTAVRSPGQFVLKGTPATSENYWKDTIHFYDSSTEDRFGNNPAVAKSLEQICGEKVGGDVAVMKY